MSDCVSEWDPVYTAIRNVCQDDEMNVTQKIRKLGIKIGYQDSLGLWELLSAGYSKYECSTVLNMHITNFILS